MAPRAVVDEVARLVGDLVPEHFASSSSEELYWSHHCVDRSQHEEVIPAKWS